MKLLELSNAVLRLWLREYGYSMDHSHADNREWLTKAVKRELENEGNK